MLSSWRHSYGQQMSSGQDETSRTTASIGVSSPAVVSTVATTISRISSSQNHETNELNIIMEKSRPTMANSSHYDIALYKRELKFGLMLLFVLLVSYCGLMVGITEDMWLSQTNHSHTFDTVGLMSVLVMSVSEIIQFLVASALWYRAYQIGTIYFIGLMMNDYHILLKFQEVILTVFFISGSLIQILIALIWVFCPKFKKTCDNTLKPFSYILIAISCQYLFFFVMTIALLCHCRSMKHLTALSKHKMDQELNTPPQFLSDFKELTINISEANSASFVNSNHFSSSFFRRSGLINVLRYQHSMLLNRVSLLRERVQ